MTPHLRHIRKHAPTHVHVAALLFAAVLALAGMRHAGVQAHPHEMPAASGMGIEAASLDGSGRAVRGVNISVLAERVSERKAASDHGFNAGGSDRFGNHSPARALGCATAVDTSAPPRLLFYLHSALLI